MIETHVRTDRRIVCRLSGDLDWIGAMSLRHVIDGWIKPGLTIVIDLGEVGGIDAVGVSALLGSVRRVNAFGGRAQVHNASFKLRRLMKSAGVYELIMGSSVSSDNGAARPWNVSEPSQPFEVPTPGDLTPVDLQGLTGDKTRAFEIHDSLDDIDNLADSPERTEAGGGHVRSRTGHPGSDHSER